MDILADANLNMKAHFANHILCGRGGERLA